jgi:heme-degrading monooxygenase HmoA
MCRCKRRLSNFERLAVILVNVRLFRMPVASTPTLKYNLSSPAVGIMTPTLRSFKMIRVHIRRSTTEKNREELVVLINHLRSAIVGQPGYLSSETLKRVDNAGEILVVSKWQSHFYWQQWFESRERTEIQTLIDELVGDETIYEIYEYE